MPAIIAARPVQINNRPTIVCLQNPARQHTPNPLTSTFTPPHAQTPTELRNPGVWMPALAGDGERSDGAAVAELTSLIDPKTLPSGTRLIVRREPLHPGAQRSLFPSLDFRYWGFYTDGDGDPRHLDVTMRAHAHVEQHIGRLKDSGLCRFPFTSFTANAAWMMTVALAADLVRWFQLLCMHGPWRDARPKALRWHIFHAPGRLVRTARRRIVRVIDRWPTTDVLLDAYRHIELLT
jgi:hypothetical protein